MLGHPIGGKQERSQETNQIYTKNNRGKANPGTGCWWEDQEKQCWSALTKSWKRRSTTRKKLSNNPNCKTTPANRQASSPFKPPTPHPHPHPHPQPHPTPKGIHGVDINTTQTGIPKCRNSGKNNQGHRPGYPQKTHRANTPMPTQNNALKYPGDAASMPRESAGEGKVYIPPWQWPSRQLNALRTRVRSTRTHPQRTVTIREEQQSQPSTSSSTTHTGYTTKTNKRKPTYEDQTEPWSKHQWRKGKTPQESQKSYAEPKRSWRQSPQTCRYDNRDSSPEEQYQQEQPPTTNRQEPSRSHEATTTCHQPPTRQTISTSKQSSRSRSPIAKWHYPPKRHSSSISPSPTPRSRSSKRNHPTSRKYTPSSRRQAPSAHRYQTTRKPPPSSRHQSSWRWPSSPCQHQPSRKHAPPPSHQHSPRRKPPPTDKHQSPRRSSPKSSKHTSNRSSRNQSPKASAVYPTCQSAVSTPLPKCSLPHLPKCSLPHLPKCSLHNLPKSSLPNLQKSSPANLPKSAITHMSKVKAPSRASLA